MIISSALKLAESAAKNAVKDSAIRFADENMSHGQAALEHVETEVRKLANEIYRYKTRFETVKFATQIQRGSSADYIQHCVKSFPMSEADGILQLREKLRKIGSVAENIEVRAIGRARSQAMAAEKMIKRWRANLSQAEKNGLAPRFQLIMVQQLRGASRDLERYMTNIGAIDLKGDALQVLCADLIGTIMEIRRQLIEESESFIYFAKDCKDWRDARLEHGIN
jgi:hypothetical protein